MSVASVVLDSQPSPLSPLSWLGAQLRRWFKPLLIACLLLLFGYGLIALYLLGEYAAAMVALLLGSSGGYIYLRRDLLAWRFMYPALALIFLIMLFPIAYSVAIAFTNYSSMNLLSYQRVVKYQLEQTYAEQGSRFEFKLYRQGERYQLLLTDNDGGLWQSGPFSMPAISVHQSRADAAPLPLHAITTLPDPEPLSMRDVIKQRKALQQLNPTLPDGLQLSLYGMREFLPLKPRFEPAVHPQLPAPAVATDILFDRQSARYVGADHTRGYYYYLDPQGRMTEELLTPGFVTQVGWNNFASAFSEGERHILLRIFLWTVSFAALTVLSQSALGLLIASLLNWHRIRGQRIYRTLFLLPFAIPAFVSIMVFGMMFNSEFGQINQLLQALFGITLEWYHNPWMAKLQVLLVNLWLGFPYFMLLGMGMLKSIPQELYEAAAMDGAGVWFKFRHITLPLLLRPMMPLLIMSFAFNFNNFNVIYLLTHGGPMMQDSTVWAGETELLINYTYNIARGARGYNDYGLAAALSALLFVLIGAMALGQYWLAREKRNRYTQEEA